MSKRFAPLLQRLARIESIVLPLLGYSLPTVKTYRFICNADQLFALFTVVSFWWRMLYLKLIIVVRSVIEAKNEEHLQMLFVFIKDKRGSYDWELQSIEKGLYTFRWMHSLPLSVDRMQESITALRMGSYIPRKMQFLRLLAINEEEGIPSFTITLSQSSPYVYATKLGLYF